MVYYCLPWGGGGISQNNVNYRILIPLICPEDTSNKQQARSKQASLQPASQKVVRRPATSAREAAKPQAWRWWPAAGGVSP